MHYRATQNLSLGLNAQYWSLKWSLILRSFIRANTKSKFPYLILLWWLLWRHHPRPDTDPSKWITHRDYPFSNLEDDVNLLIETVISEKDGSSCDAIKFISLPKMVAILTEKNPCMTPVLSFTINMCLMIFCHNTIFWHLAIKIIIFGNYAHISFL